jgi:hypothetical protein
MGPNENIKRIKNNPLRTKSDLQQLFLDIMEPLKGYYSEGCALLKVGKTCTHYSKRIEWLEGFSRPLLGLIPYTIGGGKTELWDIYRSGIKNGTDPEHPEYWGKQTGGQMMVEMSPIGLALAMVPEKIWTPLSDIQRENLRVWLNQINKCEVSNNNWLFFRVFVNLGLKKVGAEYDKLMLKDALEKIDTFYLSDGWYSDGLTNQRDYYIPFAMHFFGLIYAVIMEKDDPERAKIYKERAKIFALDFIKWFAKDGSALPFGRSLTYRFAMGAFWGAMAFANVEGFSWGVTKGLLLRHLRWWMQQDIFNNDGILSIGYAYPNLKVTEFYNSPGSINWAMKAFIVLALPDSHPFWTAEEEQLPDLPELSVQPHPYMLLCREQDRDHVFALTGGQHAKWEPTFGAAKYAKFAYSTVFGFSVPAGEYGLVQGAFDSMLAFCENDELYRVRRTCEEIKVTDKFHYSLWRPWGDVQVETWLIPVLPWHIRVHKIISQRELMAAESGFAISNMDENGDISMKNIAASNAVSSITPLGLSGIVNVIGERSPEMILAAPNTNVLYPSSVIPTLKGAISKGETWLISAVLGQPYTKEQDFDWGKCPTAELKDGELKIVHRGMVSILQLRIEN